MFFLSIVSIPYIISFYLDNSHVKKYLPYILLYYLLAFYIVIQYDKLLIQDYTEWDFFYIFPYLNTCDIFTIPQERAIIKFYQFCLSQELFGNPKIIPFVESVGILIISFLLANKISKNNFAGIVAVLIILSSKIFTDNTTSFGYSTEWAWFFILAVYLVYTKPVLSGPIFLLSILAKGITILFLPVLFYLIYKSNIPSKKAYLSLGVMISFVILYTLFAGNQFIQTNVSLNFYPEKLEGLLYNTYYNFTEEAQDPMILFLVLPLVLIGLYKKHLPFFIFIIFLFSMQIWLPLFSEYNMGSYRLAALVIMLGIGGGIGLFKKDEQSAYTTNCKKKTI